MQIPLYNQQINVGGGQPLPRAEPLQVSGAMGAAISNVAQAGESLEAGMMIRQKTNERLLAEQQEQDAKTWAGKTLSDAHLQWQQTMADRQASATGGAAGFTPQMLNDFDDYTKKTLENAPTPLARRFLQTSLDSLRTSIGSQAITFEAQARLGDRINTQTNSINNWANVVFNDPSQYDAAMNAVQQTMPEVGPEHTNRLLDFAKKTLAYAAATSVARSNPIQSSARRAWVRTQRRGAASIRAVSPVLMRSIAQKEGGFVANDNGRGPTNFGINSRRIPISTSQSSRPSRPRRSARRATGTRSMAMRFRPQCSRLRTTWRFRQARVSRTIC
jgi:hypothetical protein